MLVGRYLNLKFHEDNELIIRYYIIIRYLRGNEIKTIELYDWERKSFQLLCILNKKVYFKAPRKLFDFIHENADLFRFECQGLQEQN